MSHSIGSLIHGEHLKVGMFQLHVILTLSEHTKQCK